MPYSSPETARWSRSFNTFSSRLGGGGKTFVRPIREYVRRYAKVPQLAPGEHVIVFDEAQRAHDARRVADVHKLELQESRSEPHHFVEFAERSQDWSVVVGLIGDGQEIHTGEESGLPLWERGLRESPHSDEWTVHGPPEMANWFARVNFEAAPNLSLNETIRSHFASGLHEFVARLVESPTSSISELHDLAGCLVREGHDLRITRDLEVAKSYLRDRYQDNPNARFGLVASSRDRDLQSFGIPNDYLSTRAVKYGPWYNDDETDPGEYSCRHLNQCVTEFGAQGLELDAVLLAWGTDFRIVGNAWSIDRARKYRDRGYSTVRDPAQLRANTYRVLLTRGRDAHVVFVPPLSALDQTMSHLVKCGFRLLK